MPGCGLDTVELGCGVGVGEGVTGSVMCGRRGACADEDDACESVPVDGFREKAATCRIGAAAGRGVLVEAPVVGEAIREVGAGPDAERDASALASAA